MTTTWLTVFVITAGSVVLYLVSLTQIGFCTGDSCLQGLDILKWGWMGASASSADITWFANPITVAAFLTGVLGLRYPTAVLGGVALILASTLLLSRGVMTNEGGVVTPIDAFGSGYWMWLASMATCCLAALVQRTPA